MEVRVVRLEPLRVAYFRAVSEDPEDEAWRKLVAWAEPNGLTDRTAHRLFGFDNPNPSRAGRVYGYEMWITVGPEVTLEWGIASKQFRGGLYAVAPCAISGPHPDIHGTWMRLRAWAAASPYRRASHQWLEEHVTRTGEPWELARLDLYYPIAMNL
jgi:AraC family transcriptional regulator